VQVGDSSAYLRHANVGGGDDTVAVIRSKRMGKAVQTLRDQQRIKKNKRDRQKKKKEGGTIQEAFNKASSSSAAAAAAAATPAQDEEGATSAAAAAAAAASGGGSGADDAKREADAVELQRELEMLGISPEEQMEIIRTQQGLS